MCLLQLTVHSQCNCTPFPSLYKLNTSSGRPLSEIIPFSFGKPSFLRLEGPTSSIRGRESFHRSVGKGVGLIHPWRLTWRAPKWWFVKVTTFNFMQFLVPEFIPMFVGCLTRHGFWVRTILTTTPLKPPWWMVSTFSEILSGETITFPPKNLTWPMANLLNFWGFHI